MWIDDGFVLTAKVSVRAASSATPGRKTVHLRLPLLAELEGLSVCTAPRDAVSSPTASYVSPDTFAMDVVVLESEPSVGTTVFRFGVAILALVALLAAIGLAIWFNRDRYTM